jgi:hypothetical protein
MQADLFSLLSVEQLLCQQEISRFLAKIDIQFAILAPLVG